MVKIKHILKAQSAETYLLKAFGMNLSEDIKGLNVIRNELPSAALETSSTTHWSQQEGCWAPSMGFGSDAQHIKGKSILCSLLTVGRMNPVNLYGNPRAPHSSFVH